MSEGFRFPSQLWVLLDDDDVPVTLIFVTVYGAWSRRDREWTEWLINDDDPLHRFEGMQIAPVDPRLIDRWDRGGVTAGDVELFEYKWAPPTD